MDDALKNAIALRSGGKVEEASLAFQAILDGDPDNFDASRHLGLLEVCKGETQGIQRIEKAIQQDPDQVLGYIELGTAFHHLEKWPKALQCFERVLERHPHHAHAHFLAGVVLSKQNKAKEARQAYLRCIRANPNFAEAYFALGKLCLSEGRVKAAVRSLGNFIRVQPGDARGYTELAKCWNSTKQPEAALRALQKGQEMVPENIGILNALGQTYSKLNQLEKGAEAYKESLRLDPTQAASQSNLGGILEFMPGKQAEAEASHRKAVELEPELWDAYSNLGNFLRSVHRLDEAEAVLRKALEKDPDNFELHTTLGLVLLSSGALADGFREYGFRWQKPGKSASLQGLRLSNRPFWEGSSLEGKTVFVWPEQGNGDYLQFLRYIPMLAEQGARVILGAKKGLGELAKTVPGVSAVVAFEGPVDPRMQFDYHCPIVNLPECFGTDIESIPLQMPYLFPRSERISAWQRSLVSIKKPRVGLVWAGRPEHVYDLQRSMALEFLTPILSIKEVQYYSLQVGVNSPDVKRLPDGQVIDLSASLTNYEETAAAIENLDLVISVDTSVAHLAGALGKPVWMLLSSAPSLMWLRDRDDSPWYPSMRIFRQGDDEGWEPVIERLRAALDERYG